MKIVALGSKFNNILKEQGLLPGLKKANQYWLFLMKKNWDEFKGVYAQIQQDDLRVIIHNGKIRLYYKGIELTKGHGIIVCLSVLGNRYDSAQSGWSIRRINSVKLVMRNRCKNLPLNYILEISLLKKKEISLKLKLEMEEDLKIDEKKIILTASECYNRWEIPFEDGGLVYSNDSSADILFVFNPVESGCVPECCIGYSPGSRAIKMLIPDIKVKREYLTGEHNFFSATLALFDKSVEDQKRLRNKCDEKLFRRQDELVGLKNTVLLNGNCIETRKKDKEGFNVILVNLPWQRNGVWGVRAGSRWPHIKDKAEGGYLPFPFYLAYAAALLQKNGFRVKLIDAIAEEISETDFLSILSNIEADLLLVETSTVSLNDDMALLKKINKKDIHLVLCGPDINIRAPSFLKENGFIDCVLVGEYEFTLFDLAVNLRDGRQLGEISGLIYKDETGKLNFNAPRPLLDNLDELPWPLREQLPVKKYLDAPCEIPYPTAQMWASRGCPFRCIFCLWPQVMYGNNKYRVRNVIDVVDEMEYLVRDMGFKSIYFDDDTFNVGKSRMLDLCRQIKRRKLKVPWAIMARADLMDEEILLEMKQAGLFAAKYGVESACQELLDQSNKNMNLNKATQMIKLTKKLGIKTHLTFTFGLPGETKETIQKTLDYVFAIDPDSAQFSITTYYPGTDYFDYLNKNKLIISKDWADYDGNSKSVIQIDGLSAEYLENARKDAVDKWLAHLRLTRGFKENYRIFKRFLKREGLNFTVKKTIGYLKLRCFNNSLTGKIINLFGKSRLNNFFKKAAKYMVSGRLQRDYLDLLGVLDGAYAYKGPNFVQIDLTNDCNNDCIGCWCNSPLLLDKKQGQEAKKTAIAYWKVKELIDELDKMGAKEIYLAGGGEPFMHPMLMDIVEYIKRKKIICDINTNFTLADDDKIKKLIELELDSLVVSVWASTARTYLSTHPNKREETFYQIKERLKLLNQSKNKLPQVHIYNVINNLNFHEIEGMVDFALEVKADSVGFTVLDTIPGRTDILLLDEKQRKGVLKQCERIKRRSDLGSIKILEFDKFIKRVSTSDANVAEYDKEAVESMPCYIGWLFSRIMADGNVNACLKAHRIPVGNIYDGDFRGIWNGNLQQNFRRKTLTYKKDDSFFSLIGNDPNAKNGCYKSCDDFSRNFYMHRRMSVLSSFEKVNLELMVSLKKMRRKVKSNRFFMVWENIKLSQPLKLHKEVLKFLELSQKNKFHMIDAAVNKSFDIVLIMPPPWATRMPPLGAAYLSAYLKENGFTPFIYDFNLVLCNKARGKNKLFWRVENLNNKSPEDVAKDVVRAFKNEIRLLVDDLCLIQSKIIGFSTSLINLWVALEITKMLKAKDPSKIVIFGGPGCYWDYKRITPGLVDAFVIGEGEEVLCRILKLLKDGQSIENIPGVITFKNGCYSDLILAKPLDINTIAFPKFSEFKLKDYNKGNNYKPLPILTSRGCIGRCNYCIDCRMWGGLRNRLAEDVFGEIEFHLKNYGVHEFEFNDLICNGNLKQLEIFSDLVIKSEYKINWVSYAIIRKDMEPELFYKMKKGGCHTLIYGVESGSNTVLQRMNKYYTAEQAERVIRLTHQSGICTNINIIVGFPGETKVELNETLEFLRRNKEYIDEVTNVSGCVLFFDSAMGRQREKFGIILPEQTDPLLYQDKTGITPEERKARVRKTLSFISDLGVRCQIVNNPTQRRIKVSRLNTELINNLKE